MDNCEIFRRAVEILQSGADLALVTVIETVDSTPGKVGYKMLVSADGLAAGTVGGGPVEGEMIETARSMLGAEDARIMRFDLNDPQGTGICGGSVELLIEAFVSKSLPTFEALSNACGDAVISLIHPGRPPCKVLLKDTKQNLPAELIEAASKAIAKGVDAAKVSGGGDEAFVESLAKPPTLVIFGAGHLSQYIYRYAESLGFSVIICDDRRQFANRDRFPTAADVIAGDYETVTEQIAIDNDSYVVIVTRGHACDEAVLERVVKTDARYIGMIGSKRKTLKILDNLRQKNIPDELLQKVYSPIGIDIAALTPQEISLSIVCELVKIRRAGRDHQTGHLTICNRYTSDGPRS